MRMSKERSGSRIHHQHRRDDVETVVWRLYAVSMTDVTQILSQIEHGDPTAAEQLLPLVYDELRRLAGRKLATEKPGQTLQATALVHEAYLRLVNVEKAQHWDSRGHFFSAAAESMRRILVEAARRKSRQKHGGDLRRVEIEQAEISFTVDSDQLLAIHEALDRLSEEDPKAADLVKLRYFGGFSVSEAGEALGMSRSTAYEHWSYARAWLKCEIDDWD